MNNVLKNSGPTSTYSSGFDYSSGFLNFLNFETLYLSSANLSDFNTIGARGESSIIKKIVVNSGFGSTIVDTNVLPYDYLGCSRQVLKTLSFKVQDIYGKAIPLHGQHVSFSIIFLTVREDI